MSYQVFKESEIRRAIEKKAPIEIKSGKRAKHQIAFLYDGDTVVGTVKLPNPHSKEFTPGKSKEKAKELFLSKDQFNEFFSCRMKAKEYAKHLSAQIKKQEDTLNEGKDVNKVNIEEVKGSITSVPDEDASKVVSSKK